eukprot:CAMPEP_0170510924 /NCGR_PEP_ID=MMETSP0208-20121228/66027_1 /TAXON_ID=197538 /ORGANISM="Strombidium inclinatum, Strain S3" /LENGTH=90 /DNA_ID=CAMNT_0010794419 /DNA_START=1226 /DNA_END=1498 /DNA_ORIENTATION=-
MSIGMVDLLHVKSKVATKNLTCTETSSEACPPDEENPFEKGAKVEKLKSKMQFEGLRALNDEELSGEGQSQSEVRDSIIQIHNNLQLIKQ